MNNQEITLNVGGTIFVTNINTLTHRSEFFKIKFDRWDNDEKIFIDRSPKAFEHVLELLRDPNYFFPKKYKSELDYFLINYDEEKLKPETNEIITNLEKKIIMLKNEIAELKTNYLTNNQNDIYRNIFPAAFNDINCSSNKRPSCGSNYKKSNCSSNNKPSCGSNYNKSNCKHC